MFYFLFLLLRFFLFRLSVASLLGLPYKYIKLFTIIADYHSNTLVLVQSSVLLTHYQEKTCSLMRGATVPTQCNTNERQTPVAAARGRCSCGATNNCSFNYYNYICKEEEMK